jgi:hypothetical protein
MIRERGKSEERKGIGTVHRWRWAAVIANYADLRREEKWRLMKAEEL